MKLFIFILLSASNLLSISASGAENQERALIAFMKVRPGTEAQFLNEAQAVIKDSRLETGVIRYQLHRSEKDPQQFVFYELFKSSAALDFHKNSPHVKSFLSRTSSITVKFTLESFAPIGTLQ